jgi:hypothetical protein
MEHQRMIPLGYMLKNVASPPPDWMKASAVRAVHSLSNCVSADFSDYIPLWKHNGWWLFDTPGAVKKAAAEEGVSSDKLALFYYEAFDEQYNDEADCWESFGPEASFPTAVVPPISAVLSGYDVVTFYVGTSPECSPLSCNALASELRVNERCLFDSFEEAYAAVAQGKFKDSEPGPYRIVAVYSVEPPTASTAKR